MAEELNYSVTRQGVRDLDRPARPAEGSRVNVGPGERAASTVGGALLAGFGVGQEDLFGLLVAATGAALIYRGASGHCAAYSAVGINTTR